MPNWGWLGTLAAIMAVPALAQGVVCRRARHVEGRKRIDHQWHRKLAPSGLAPGRPEVGGVALTLTIDKQDGRRFSGTFSSARATEKIVGVISRNGTLYYVDSDGYAFATLLASNRLESCYLQITSNGQVACCTEMTKQP
jgi:hypothetical protein